MKTFKQFISEAKQVGSLYHYTNAGGAKAILKSNSLKASGQNSNGASEHVSATRDKNLHKTATNQYGYRHRRGVPMDVSFELDGDKISNNHKLSPYMYARAMNKPESEAEETIKRKTLPNIKSYIKSIRIHSPLTWSDEHELKQHGIPVHHVS